MHGCILMSRIKVSKEKKRQKAKGRRQKAKVKREEQRAKGEEA